MFARAEGSGDRGPWRDGEGVRLEWVEEDGSKVLDIGIIGIDVGTEYVLDERGVPSIATT